MDGKLIILWRVVWQIISFDIIACEFRLYQHMNFRNEQFKTAPIDEIGRFQQQNMLIQQLTGVNEQEVLESAKKSYMSEWLMGYLANNYGEKVSEVLSPRKFRNLVVVRAIFSYFMHKKLNYSLPKIGRLLGNRDHTTILGVKRKVETNIATDPEYARKTEELWQKAEGEFEEYVRKTNKQLNAPENPEISRPNGLL